MASVMRSTINRLPVARAAYPSARALGSAIVSGNAAMTSSSLMSADSSIENRVPSFSLLPISSGTFPSPRLVTTWAGEAWTTTPSTLGQEPGTAAVDSIVAVPTEPIEGSDRRLRLYETCRVGPAKDINATVGLTECSEQCSG